MTEKSANLIIAWFFVSLANLQSFIFQAVIDIVYHHVQESYVVVGKNKKASVVFCLRDSIASRFLTQ